MLMKEGIIYSCWGYLLCKDSTIEGKLMIFLKVGGMEAVVEIMKAPLSQV